MSIKTPVFVLLSIVLAATAISGCCTTSRRNPSPAAPAPVRVCPSTTPTGDWWISRFEQKEKGLAQVGPGSLVFLGDSITHYWESTGKAVYDAHYTSKYPTLDFGFSADRTQQVLWRLEHGRLAKYPPRLVVIMIGTNNLGQDNPDPLDDTFEGVAAILDRLQADCPKTKILLLAVFPRGKKPSDPIRQEVAKLNARLPGLARSRGVEFLDPGAALLEPDGTILKATLPDFLHPSAAGYERVAKAMDPVIARLMKE